MSERLEVLLLDDEPIVGKRLKPALAKIGCNVEVFEDPREASPMCAWMKLMASKF